MTTNTARYEITLNGKPVRETNGQLVDEAVMKIAVIDLQLALTAGDIMAYIKPVQHGSDHSFVVKHHGGVDIIDVVKRHH